MPDKIAVLGAGAIGGVIGGYLDRAGRDVTLIDMWPANIERIKEKGLTVTPQEEEFTVHPKALHLGEVAAARPAFDAVFLSVKSYDTEWSVKFIEPYLAPGGYIVSAQNSINDDAIAAIVGWTREVGCIVMLGAGMYEPGHVLRTTIGDWHSFTLGETSGLITPRIESLAEILSDVGPVETTTNLWGERWSKLAINCQIAGFTGLTSAETRQNADTRSLAIKVTAELLEVARALGVSVEPIVGIEPNKYEEALTDRAVKEEVESILVEASKALRESRPSLAQDVMKGRKTEVDMLNGYVARKGAEVGVATPLNQAVLKVTKRLESGELQPSISNLKHITSLPGTGAS